MRWLDVLAPVLVTNGVALFLHILESRRHTKLLEQIAENTKQRPG